MFDDRSKNTGTKAARGWLFLLAMPALLIALSGTAQAGSDERKGTGGALEMRIPVGPRGTALGGSVVSSSEGIEALFWNPAGLAGMTGTQAMFSNTQYFAEMQVNYVGVATQVGGFGALGLSVKALNVGEILVTTEAAPEGTGDIIDPTFTVIGLTYAREFTDRVKFGGTVSFVNEAIRSVSASGIAFDFGVLYATGWRTLNLGLAMKNFGTTMQFDGDEFGSSQIISSSDPSAAPRTLRATSSKFEMPSYFSLGAAYDLVDNSQYQLKALGAFQNNNFVGDNMSAGLEWVYRRQLALRASYMGSITSTLDAATGDESVEFDSGDDLYAGWALGASAGVKAGNTNLDIDFSYRPLKDEFFDDIYEIGVKLKF
jgi:hypothetical protein